jgi:hypothetical protein
LTAPLIIRSASEQDERRAMQIPSRYERAAVYASGKRCAAAAVVLCVGAMLGSCAGGASEDGVSAYVADHWPHWAGGMPSDVPPRPGAPGYNEFIAHGQADQNAPPSGSGGTASVVAGKPVLQTAPQAPAVAAEPAKPAQAAAGVESAPQSAAEDLNVMKGGLY